jgi:hypothetical protein
MNIQNVIVQEMPVNTMCTLIQIAPFQFCLWAYIWSLSHVYIFGQEYTRGLEHKGYKDTLKKIWDKYRNM